MKSYHVSLFLKSGEIIEGKIKAKNSQLAANDFACQIAKERGMVYYWFRELVEDCLAGEVLEEKG